MPKISATSNEIMVDPVNGKLIWPTYGQSAVGVENYGVLATNGEQKAAPIASIAKTMVALSVLKERPLKIGEQGPMITMTANDEEFFRQDFAQNGSVVPIRIGEELSEYQAIQALLLPSGDNIASTLAVWAFGSVEEYLTYANNLAKDLGLEQTYFADASGLSPQTVSSAQNLVVLGEKVMAEPVLAEIVGQSSVTLPVAGKVNNYNTILGIENIVGIKTGNTDEAGGCFLFASKRSIGSKEAMVIGVILGATSRNQALSDTKTFLRSNSSNFVSQTVVSEGQIVGSYRLPWGKEVNILAKDDLSVITIPGAKQEIKANFSSINKSTNKGSEVGRISVSSGTNEISVSGILDEKVSKPPFFWKLLHP